MNILFYYPSNKRTIPIDIPLFKLMDRGHTLFLLTTSGRGSLHDLYKSKGVEVHFNVVNSQNTLLRFVSQLRFLIRFCKAHKIDVVHSHLQQANIISVFAGLFMNSRVINFRHHCKFHFLVGRSNLRPTKREVVGDWLINRLSKRIIVPSNSVKNMMLEYENVAAKKVSIIPYIYDFEKMEDVDSISSEKIRAKYSGVLRLIMVSRMTPYKRHMEVVKPVTDLIKSGYSIQLLIMDDGPEKMNIHSYIREQQMEDSIHLLGFRSNILDYINAVDVIIHPSLTEASNSAIKEAALMKKLVIACENVGDFDEYIQSGLNGFLLSPDSFASEVKDLIKRIYKNFDGYKVLGERLQQVVKARFKIAEEVVDLYENL